MRRYLAPLVSAGTVRAGVYLVIGGVLAGAYGALATGFAQMFASEQTPRGAVVVLALVTAGIVLLPPFLAPVRTLEVLAVRTFLDVDAADLPDPVGRPSAATRWRGAAWYALHLALGTVVTLGLLVVVPIATQLVLSALGLDRQLLADLVPARTLHPLAGAAVAVVLVVVLPYLTALARALLRQASVPLLGPDQSARIAELEARADRLAERGRLARELHDSVGHALTITTLQAAAAARQVETDPEAARRSLAAVEEAGRSAMADLDHVLGLLRASEGTGSGVPADRAPARSLADLPGLVADARQAGVDVCLDAHLPGLDRADGTTTEGVPRATSHEIYRVVQEALTNAARHAPGAPVVVRIAAEELHRVDVQVTNPLRGAGVSPDHAREDSRRPDGLVGHGLPGMAERVRLLRGELTAGPEGGLWVVRARLPVS